MTDETRELLYSQIDLHKNPKTNKILLSSIPDNNLKDLVEISQIDDTFERRFCKTYYRYITRNVKEHQERNLMDNDEDYTIFLDIVNKYYLTILKDYVNLRPSYIYGILSEDRSRVLRDMRMYPNILKYVQDLFMSFLSSENQIIYRYMCNNDCPGLATYYIDKYKDIKIDYYLNDIVKIWNELRFINGIHIIGKSPVSLYHQENSFKREFERYLKDSGLKEMYKQLGKDRIKKVSSIDAIKIIKAFVENENYESIYRFYERYYPDRNYSVDVALVKEFDPQLHVKYSEKVESNSKTQYAILLSTGRRLKNAIIESKYKLSFLDFLKIYNPKSLAGIINYYKHTIKNLPPDMYSVINSYLRRVGMTQIEKDEIMNTKISINGRVLLDEEKELILSYIKDNNLPYMNRVYNELYRGYFDGSIDLNKSFKESEEQL